MTFGGELAELYARAAQPHEAITAPLPTTRQRLIDYEQRLAELAEISMLSTEEWQLVGRQLPTETEALLRQLEAWIEGFPRGSLEELDAAYERLFDHFCAWNKRLQAISDPAYAERPLARLLARCSSRAELPLDEAIEAEMLELRRLPVARLVGDQQEQRFYLALCELGRLLSWLRLSEPRQFLVELQIAEPKMVAAAAAALTLESPSFALACARLEAVWPESGSWCLAELMRSLYLSMLPPLSRLPQLEFGEVRERLRALASRYGENVWGKFGEQVLVRYGGFTWLLEWLGNQHEQVSRFPPHIAYEPAELARFKPPPFRDVKVDALEPLLIKLLLLLNAAERSSALQAKNNELQQAIADLGAERMREVDRIGARQQMLNERWCALVPLEACLSTQDR